jgi:hypothetical protein
MATFHVTADDAARPITRSAASRPSVLVLDQSRDRDAPVGDDDLASAACSLGSRTRNPER